MDALENFERAEKMLRELFPKAEIINPMRLPAHAKNTTWLEFIITDLKEVEKCTHIYFTHFGKSDGMKIENIVAMRANLKRIRLINILWKRIRN